MVEEVMMLNDMGFGVTTASLSLPLEFNGKPGSFAYISCPSINKLYAAISRRGDGFWLRRVGGDESFHDSYDEAAYHALEWAKSCLTMDDLSNLTPVLPA